MGLFSRNSDNVENIGKVISGNATDIIKRLSGKDVQYSQKIIDNVVVFSGASGGTGVSTLVSNTAYTAKNRGLKVLLIDLNISYPSQHRFFRCSQELGKKDLVSYLLGKNPLGESIESVKSMGIMCSYNRSLMDDINCESEIAINNFDDMLTKVRQLYDLVLIDCPMRLEHKLINTAFYICNHIYLVLDEGIGSLSNTEKIRRNMATSGIDAYAKMSVILNKRTNIHFTTYPFEKLNIQLEQILPFDVAIIESSLQAEVFCEKGSSISKNSKDFYTGINEITSIILKNGGYIG